MGLLGFLAPDQNPDTRAWRLLDANCIRDVKWLSDE